MGKVTWGGIPTIKPTLTIAPVITLPSPPVQYIETIKEIPIDVIKYIDREIEIVREVIKEVPIYVNRDVIKEVPTIITQIKEVPVEVIKEIKTNIIDMSKHFELEQAINKHKNTIKKLKVALVFAIVLSVLAVMHGNR